MRSVDEDIDGMYARWMLEDAQVRAMARRQLSLSIPIVIAGAFAAAISTFSLGHPAPPSPTPQRAPLSSPDAHHVVVLVSGGVDREMTGATAGWASPDL